MAKKIFYSLAALVCKILFCHSKIKFISSRHRVISSMCGPSLALQCYAAVFPVKSRKVKEMTRGDKGKLFTLFVPLFTLSLYSARLCAPCGFACKVAVSLVNGIKIKVHSITLLCLCLNYVWTLLHLWINQNIEVVFHRTQRGWKLKSCVEIKRSCEVRRLKQLISCNLAVTSK